ncbi:hypothetical protein BpHYR1_039381 [Brachionus plicatilis]|uniref:Uncharacterized protein n=1 Tax=Brachionus plicatilis TaxID=10195 RepID=A0A3M7SUA0_BRAPC|nr:hypothetical protein BpHYR1_039381 [Brachionus plicatilis]
MIAFLSITSEFQIMFVLNYGLNKTTFENTFNIDSNNGIKIIKNKSNAQASIFFNPQKDETLIFCPEISYFSLTFQSLRYSRQGNRPRGFICDKV